MFSETGNAPLFPAYGLHHATGAKSVKGEDVLFVSSLAIQTEFKSMLYLVCDGHSGVDAATYVSANFLQILNSKLPEKPPPLRTIGDYEQFAGDLRRILCETFIALDNMWISFGPANYAGTTVSAAVCVGRLLSVACVGDSQVVLDTGGSVLELTGSHRLQVNREEQVRLTRAGCQVAPLGHHLQGPARPNELGVGPLRLWPGGLCVSRSIGDLDAGTHVLPMPHVKQVLLPLHGARMIAASDGLWDAMTLSRAAKISRTRPTDAAVRHILDIASRERRLTDDCSVIVVDFLPSGMISFPDTVERTFPKSKRSLEKSGSGSKLFSCFKPDLGEPDSRDATGDAHLSFLSDLDTLKVFPELKAAIQRLQLAAQTRRADAVRVVPPLRLDFTQHESDRVAIYGGNLSPANSGSLGGGNAYGSIGASSSYGGGISSSFGEQMLTSQVSSGSGSGPSLPLSAPASTSMLTSSSVYAVSPCGMGSLGVTRIAATSFKQQSRGCAPSGGLPSVA